MTPRAALLAALLTAAPARAAAQADPAAGDTTRRERFRLSGFVLATAYIQDQILGPGNGQNSVYVADSALARRSWFHGADVRFTRLMLDIPGPEAFGKWTTSAVIQADFFGDFAPGSAGREQPIPRLRLAYAQLERGRTRLRLGQDDAPLNADPANNASSLSFPLGYGSTGILNWRFPGVFLRRELRAPLPTPDGATGRAADDRTRRTGMVLHLAAFRGSWDDAADAERPSVAQAGLLPELEARLDVAIAAGSDTLWSAYLVGHYDRKDLNGVGAGPQRLLHGRALSGGIAADPGRWTIVTGGYVGGAMGHFSGHINQFGDLRGWGAWSQVGYHLADRWGVVLLTGDERVRGPDLDPGDRARNRFVTGMLRYTVGGHELGLARFHTRTTFAGGPGSPVRHAGGQQIAFNALLRF